MIVPAPEGNAVMVANAPDQTPFLSRGHDGTDGDLLKLQAHAARYSNP